MDATGWPLDDEQVSELAALRVRAYGPTADIAEDPIASARLQQLESLLRAARPTAPKGTDTGFARDSAAEPTASDPLLLAEGGAGVPRPTPSLPPRERAGFRVSSGADMAADPIALTDPNAAEDQPAPAAHPWWRRGSAWVVIGIAAAAVVAVFSVVSVSPPPDAVLSRAINPVPAESESIDVVMLAYYDLDASDLIQHQQFRGVRVWSADNPLGERCLFVGWTGASWRGNCVPDGLDPVVDIGVFPEMPLFTAGIPNGSVVRFTLLGDDVDVRIAAGEKDVT